MAKVAAPASNSLQIGGGLKVGPMVKRKTPSELRGEQLKRTTLAEVVDEYSVPLAGSKGATEVDKGLKKPELQRNPRYIDTRMDELYPIKKSRFGMLSGKENSKQENTLKEQPSSLRHLSLLSDIAARKRQQLPCQENVASAEVCDDAKVQARQTIERCSQSRFLSVTELSSGGDGSSSSAAVDMDKALKALAVCETLSGFPAESSEKCSDPSSKGAFCSEFHVPGKKVPLDLTLKNYMRLVSSSSVNWIHRAITCSTFNGMPQFRPKSCNLADQDICKSSGPLLASQVLNTMPLHSWVHPQSTLPPSLISVLTSSATDGVEMDFFRKRQLAWEDSFRSLYYLLRKNVCNIFYVCTSHFLVLFTSGCGSAGINAYISQSTRSLRAMLKEHDISFSMPLCQTKIEQVTTEDLVELSEIEKHNLGQTCRRSSFSDIDNSPESLLAFIGNGNVHGLYDFLLNYRSSLSFLTTMDVPVLYSPVPFKNAALSSPEVKCMEMKRNDHITAAPRGSPSENDPMKGSPSGLCYIVEIKDAYIPPWILSSLCAIMGADGSSFEASFVTERTSVGLNVALPEVSEKTDAESPVDEGAEEKNDAFSIPGVTMSPHLRSGQLKSLKYCGDSYMVSLSPL